MDDLFIQPDLPEEKTAGEVDLPEDPNQWPQTVLQELHKQVPYIGDFQPHVTMERVDSERGYGQGQIEISNKSEAQAGTSPQMAEAAGIRAVRIPVVIQDYKLAPFDLLVDDQSRVLPLTESRLRQSLFRPQPFDVTSQTPGDQSMIGQLYPPYRQNFGFGGGFVQEGGKTASVIEECLIKELEARDDGFRRPKEPEETKVASSTSVRFRKADSLLEATVATFRKGDIDEFFDKLGADQGLQAAYSQNSHAIVEALGILAGAEPMTLEKTAHTVASSIKPTVVQIRRGASSYLLKSASALYWRPLEAELTRGELVRQFGEKVALATDEAGQVTMSEGSTMEDEGPLDQESPEPVDEPGLYKVVDEEGGKELVGFVVPNLLDTDGTPLPLAMFTNGSHVAVQPSIVGVPAGEGSNLPTGTPNGSGAFFSYTDNGALQATIPMELSGGSYASPGEPSTMRGETFDGRPVEVSIQPNLQTVVGSPEGKMLVPDHWQWTPLGEADSVSLVDGEESAEGSAPEDWHEGAPEWKMDGGEEQPAEEKASHVTVVGDHTGYSFSGAPVAKLASVETQLVDIDQAMFLLAGLGVDQAYGLRKLARAGNEPQRVKVGWAIKTAAEMDDEARASARKLSSFVRTHLRRDLSKEAAGIPDPSAVDTVLSLGFINPENAATFVSYLPTIEEAQTKMCNLLLAARLGVQSLPVTALERAIRSTEETIEGLKILAFQG